MKRSIALIVVIATVVSLTAISSYSQTSTSRITGTITDSTGASIPGAKVTLKNVDTGILYTQVTSTAGVYSFPSIPAGAYSVSTELAGFKTYIKTNIMLEVDTPKVENISLEVGQTTELVTIEGGYEKLQTANAVIGNIVEQKAIERLPLNGRNPLTLITMEAGVLQRSSGAGSNTVSVNGSRDRAFNVTIDGIDANESSVPGAVGNIYRINPDNIREFKVTTNNATAEEGRNSGATVSIASRGGSNEFHGTAFHFLRNDALNSREFYTNALGGVKRTMKLNQFGFEMGGPIRRNKTHFFGSWQNNIINITQPIDQSGGVPVVYSPMALSGIYRYFVPDPETDPKKKILFSLDGQTITRNSPLLVNSKTGALRSEVPLCSATVTFNCVASFNIFANDPRKIGLDKVMGALFKSFPSPNTYAGVSTGIDGLNTGGYAWNPPTQFRGPAIMARIDHNFNENNSVYGRFLYSDYNTLKGDPLNSRPQIFPGDFPALGEVYRKTSNLAINYRRTLSSNIVNEFVMGYSRFEFLFTQGEADPDFPNILPFAFTTIATPFNNTPRTYRAVTTPQFVDNLSIVKGAHQFKTGFNFRFYRHVDQRGQPGGVNVTPNLSFLSTLRSSGISLPSGVASGDQSFMATTFNQLLGIPARLQQVFLGDFTADQFLPFTADGKVNLHGTKHILNQYNFYFQDEWKLRTNLTLSYGVRWELNRPPTTSGNRVYVPGSPIVGSSGLVTFKKADSWIENDNFSTIGPKFSIAYSPEWKAPVLKQIFGSGGKSVIRVGYGLAFDPVSSFQVTAVSGRVPGIVFTCSSTLTNSGKFNNTTPGCTPAQDGANLRIADGFPMSLSVPSVKPSSLLTPPKQLNSNAPTLTMFDPKLQLPTSHQWSLSIQRELPGGLTLQSAYIGRRGLHLFRSYDINQINADPILKDFNIMRSNIGKGCLADGTSVVTSTVNCTTGQSVSMVTSKLVTPAFVTSSTTRTELQQNEAGAFAERIENTTLAMNLRPNQQFSRITYIDSGGDSYYHALQLTLRKRFGKGLGLAANYTVGKSIDNGSVDPVAATSGGGLSTTTVRAPVDSRNYKLERARSDFDRRHSFNLSSVWELPFGKGERFGSGMHPFLNSIFGNWSVNTIYTAMSGEPFSVMSGARTSNNAHISRAVMMTPVEAELQDVPGKGMGLFKDATAFALPEPGENGMSRNAFTAPSYWNVDFGVVKVFQLSERFKLQFRSEFFNAFNHANFDNIRDATATGTSSILSNSFGLTCCANVSTPSSQSIIQTGETGRVIQFALKLSF